MRVKALSPTAIVVSIFALAVFTILPMGAAAHIGDNFVYVMTNKSPHNSIVTFRRASDGALTFAHETLTGGSGTGPNGADPLGSQDSLVLSGDGLVLRVCGKHSRVNLLKNPIEQTKVNTGQQIGHSAQQIDAPS